MPPTVRAARFPNSCAAGKAWLCLGLGLGTNDSPHAPMKHAYRGTHVYRDCDRCERLLYGLRGVGKYPLDSSKQRYDPVLGNPSGTYGTIFNVLRAIADSNWNTTKCPESAKGFSRERMQESSRSQRAGCHSGHNIGQWFDD